MARITKLELEQLLAARNKELEALRLEVSQLRAHVQSMRSTPRPAQSTRSEPRPKKRDEVGDIVSTYQKRDGTMWNKVRIDYNTYAHRQVQ